MSWHQYVIFETGEGCWTNVYRWLRVVRSEGIGVALEQCQLELVVVARPGEDTFCPPTPLSGGFGRKARWMGWSWRQGKLTSHNFSFWMTNRPFHIADKSPFENRNETCQNLFLRIRWNKFYIVCHFLYHWNKKFHLIRIFFSNKSNLYVWDKNEIRFFF